MTSASTVNRMRKVIAWVFNYSLDGLLADRGTPFLDYCLRQDADPQNFEQQLQLYRTAHALMMGRTTYEGMAKNLPGTDSPFAPVMEAANKVVFSTTMQTAEWANTTIASGDTTEEIDKLRNGGDGHIVVFGGVTLWRSLMRLDLIDEWRFDLYPWIAGEGTRLFEDVPKNHELELVSSKPSTVNGLLELTYQRRR